MKVTRKKSGVHRRIANKQISPEVLDTISVLPSEASAKSAEVMPSSIDTVTGSFCVAWEYYLA